MSHTTAILPVCVSNIKLPMSQTIAILSVGVLNITLLACVSHHCNATCQCVKYHMTCLFYHHCRTTCLYVKQHINDLSVFHTTVTPPVSHHCCTTCLFHTTVTPPVCVSNSTLITYQCFTPLSYHLSNKQHITCLMARVYFQIKQITMRITCLVAMGITCLVAMCITCLVAMGITCLVAIHYLSGGRLLPVW